MTAQVNRHAPGVLAILAASTLWGTTGVSATFAPSVGPLAIGAATMGIGGLLLALWALAPLRAHRAALRPNFQTTLVGALAVAAYPLAFYSAMHFAGVTVGTVVSIGSAPLCSALLERLLDKVRITLRWMLAALLGIAGMTILGVTQSTGTGTIADGHLATLGVVLGLIAGFSYALYSWVARHLMDRGLPSRAAMGTIFGGGSLMLLPVLAFTGQAYLDAWSNVAVGLYLAIVPMFLAYLLFGYGLARVRTSTATTLSLLEPVVAAGLAAIIVGERISLHGWFGIALILGCLILTTLPARKRIDTQAMPDAMDHHRKHWWPRCWRR